MISSGVFIILGVLVGCLGSLLGVGGGFILVPFFFLFMPHLGVDTITGASLTLVFFNALSGSIAYSLKKRIDYRAALLFALAGVPGALLGALMTSYIPKSNFQLGFGCLMILMSIYLFQHSRKQPPQNASPTDEQIQSSAQGPQGYNLAMGIGISLFIGFMSSLLGIGGGIVHVPLMIRVLHFPVLVATATSHLILSIVSLSSVLEHLWRGTISPLYGPLLWLIPSVMVGAQVGAHFSDKVKDIWLLRILSAVLFLTGLRFFWISQQLVN